MNVLTEDMNCDPTWNCPVGFLGEDPSWDSTEACISFITFKYS